MRFFITKYYEEDWTFCLGNGNNGVCIFTVSPSGVDDQSDDGLNWAGYKFYNGTTKYYVELNIM